MKNINVCLLAAVACTYSIQVSANSLEHNLNFVIEDNVFSLHSSSAASHTVTPLELKPMLISDTGVKLAAVCALARGGCDGLGFGSGNNNIDLDESSQCRDEGFVNSCPSGQIPDINNKCPYNNSFFKCRVCSHTCNSGSLAYCSSDQVETGSSRNDCNETCYTCRAKTCEEGGYASSITSCQKASAVNFAGKTCYSGVSNKTCTDGGYVAAIPANNSCTSTSYCGNTCYHTCSQPTCAEASFKDAIPTNNICTATTYYGRTCYKDCYQPNCGAGGYNASIPANNLCSSVNYYGQTCYQNCYQPACSAGGFEASIPAGKICDAVSYYGRSCYSNCRVAELTPQQKCANEGFTATSCAKYMTIDNCSYDNQYKKCTHTCGSRIYENNPTYSIDEINYNGVTVITKNATHLSGGKTVYSNINFPQYAECAALPKPKIIMSGDTSYAPRIGADRIENIDVEVSITPWVAPGYCSEYSNYKNSGFCLPKCQSSYDYNCCPEYSYCEHNCKYGGMYENDASCIEYKNFISKYYRSPCQIDDSECNRATSPSIGLNLDTGASTRTETYTCNNSSTKYFSEMTLKNVNIKVNGSVDVAASIGGGAHYDKTVMFEGSNSITGGSKFSLWVRGHNTCAYGKVRGVLQVKSGGSLSIGNKACVYNQWNGVYQNSGSVSGTVQQNCTTFPLSW